jgi:quercetin dioxygenase-like cupin family protein
MGAVALLASALTAAWPAHALAQKLDANGIGRTEVVRHDLDGAHEAIQVRVDFGPHASFPLHSHPGVEIAHVLAGGMEYVLNGKPVELKAGESLFIPAGAVHSARNLGDGNAAELATYLVEKNKPIVVLAKAAK